MVADRYIRNLSRLGQGILPTQNAPPKYFGFCLKETERRVCWQEQKKTDTGFQEAEAGVYCLAFFIFRCLVQCVTFFVTVNVTFGTCSYFRLLSEVETDMLFLNAEVPLT